LGKTAWDILPFNADQFFLIGLNSSGTNFLYQMEPSGVVSELKNFGLDDAGAPVTVLGSVVAGNTLFSIVSGNSELWKSDGTIGGTAKVKDLDLAEGKLVAVGNHVYFSTLASGATLNISDGTEQGTIPLKNFSTNTVLNLYPFEDKLVFTPVDASTGKELWITDGTEANTILLKDIYAGASDAIDMPWFARKGNELFFAAKTAEHGEELWKTNGTPEGTSIVKDVVPGVQSSSPSNLTTVGDQILFSVSRQNGDEIWSTDGTEENTKLVLGVSEEFEYTDPRNFIKIESKLIFIATSPTLKDYLYSYDETVTGLPEDEMQTNVSAYPNPSTGKISLSLGSSIEVEFSVFDSKGSSIMQSRMIKQSDIDLYPFPAGIYIIKFQNSSKVSAIKVVKY
jgi:ELWxxDGT repeat protein